MLCHSFQPNDGNQSRDESGRQIVSLFQFFLFEESTHCYNLDEWRTGRLGRLDVLVWYEVTWHVLGLIFIWSRRSSRLDACPSWIETPRGLELSSTFDGWNDGRARLRHRATPRQFSRCAAGVSSGVSYLGHAGLPRWRAMLTILNAHFSKLSMIVHHYTYLLLYSLSLSLFLSFLHIIYYILSPLLFNKLNISN